MKTPRMLDEGSEVMLQVFELPVNKISRSSKNGKNSKNSTIHEESHVFYLFRIKTFEIFYGLVDMDFVVLWCVLSAFGRISPRKANHFNSSTVTCKRSPQLKVTISIVEILLLSCILIQK